MAKKRVRSLQHATPFEIDDWSSIDFALFYERQEDKKYNLSIDDYKKKCADLESTIKNLSIAYEKALENALIAKEDEMKKNFKIELKESLHLKEEKMSRKFALIIEKNNVEYVKEIMQIEIDKKVKLREAEIQKQLEEKYNIKINHLQKNINKLYAHLMKLNKQEKPKRDGKTFPSRYVNECYVCKGLIKEGDPICRAVFSNGLKKYIHEDCCWTYMDA